MDTKDYADTDRYMSSWVVRCVRNGVKHYISDNESETATDMFKNARVYRFWDHAEGASVAANAEPGFAFGWEPVMVPQAMNER